MKESTVTWTAAAAQSAVQSAVTWTAIRVCLSAQSAVTWTAIRVCSIKLFYYAQSCTPNCAREVPANQGKQQTSR